MADRISRVILFTEKRASANAALKVLASWKKERERDRSPCWRLFAENYEHIVNDVRWALQNRARVRGVFPRTKNDGVVKNRVLVVGTYGCPRSGTVFGPFTMGSPGTELQLIFSAADGHLACTFGEFTDRSYRPHNVRELLGEPIPARVAPKNTPSRQSDAAPIAPPADMGASESERVVSAAQTGRYGIVTDGVTVLTRDGQVLLTPGGRKIKHASRTYIKSLAAALNGAVDDGLLNALMRVTDGDTSPDVVARMSAFAAAHSLPSPFLVVPAARPAAHSESSHGWRRLKEAAPTRKRRAPSTRRELPPGAVAVTQIAAETQRALDVLIKNAERRGRRWSVRRMYNLKYLRVVLSSPEGRERQVWWHPEKRRWYSS